MDKPCKEMQKNLQVLRNHLLDSIQNPELPDKNFNFPKELSCVINKLNSKIKDIQDEKSTLYSAVETEISGDKMDKAFVYELIADHLCSSGKQTILKKFENSPKYTKLHHKNRCFAVREKQIEITALENAFKRKDLEFFKEWAHRVLPEKLKKELNFDFSLIFYETKMSLNDDTFVEKRLVPFINNIENSYGEHVEDILKITEFLIFRQKLSREEIIKIEENAFISIYQLCLSALFRKYDCSNHEPLTTFYLASKRVLDDKKYFTESEDSNGAAESNSLKTLLVDADPKYVFHNVFVCPVIKEEIEIGDKIVRLPCDHLISYNSFKKIIENTHRPSQCPTCPVRFSEGKTKLVVF